MVAGARAVGVRASLSKPCDRHLVALRLLWVQCSKMG